MTKKRNSKLLAFILIGIILLVGFIYNFLKQNSSNRLGLSKRFGPYEMTEIYKSERGFGADHFDIYKLKHKDDNKHLDEKPVDEDYYQKIKGFKTMMKNDMDSIKNYSGLVDSIDYLEKSDDTNYYYEQNQSRGYKLLYIYNSEKDTGYLFDLKI